MANKSNGVTKMGRVFIFLVMLPCLGMGNLYAATAQDAARAYNKFGFQLLTQCRATLPNTNFFLSPAGAAFALSMVENGAKGQTLREMATVLQTENLPLIELNQANKALLDRLSSLNPKIQLQIANALWSDKNAEIEPQFTSVNHDSYNAEVSSADFHAPATVNAINNWVSAHTDGKIPTIVEAPLDPALRLIVLDALYFKGDWLKPFDTNQTHDLPFILEGGQTITHPRMNRSGKFNYDEEDNFQAVALPYAGGGVNMYVFLPKGSLSALLQQLTSEQFDGAIQRMEPRQGTVELPRFKLQNDYNLTSVLKAMGMGLPFSAEADFSGISQVPLRISWIKQKTYVDVNEQGTVAAAVTGVMVGAMAVRREPPPFRMIVDRPFFLAIRERQTGLILFLGAVSDPR